MSNIHFLLSGSFFCHFSHLFFIWTFFLSFYMVSSLISLFAGYIGSVSFLNTILEVVKKLRSVNPKLTYG